MSSITLTEAARELTWYTGLNPKHWRVLTASWLGWVFDGYEAYALFIVMPFVLKAPCQTSAAPVAAGA